MPAITVQLETAIEPTFRVKQVAGLFDVPLSKRSSLDISVHLPPLEGQGADWRIGAIVGPSGSGKSAVAREWLAPGVGDFIETSNWPAAPKACVEGFPAGLGMDAITGTLAAVGFSSPPAWILPYACLSTGQRMRCDLARALLLPRPLIAFDEFTSVVDRQVGKAASMAVSKAVRKRTVPVERFVAVTCHYDVLDWLEPDWVLDMATRTLVRNAGWGNKSDEVTKRRSDGVQAASSLRHSVTPSLFPRGWLRRSGFALRVGVWKRPAIEIEIRRGSGRDVWPLFKAHHYLSAKLHPAARVYVALWNQSDEVTKRRSDEVARTPSLRHSVTSSLLPVGLCATLSNAGHKGRRIITRIVVLPDYQGMGIGLRLLEAVCGLEADEGYRMSIRTSHPALIASLRNRAGWSMGRMARFGSRHRGGGTVPSSGGSRGRTVATFCWR